MAESNNHSDDGDGLGAGGTGPAKKDLPVESTKPVKKPRDLLGRGDSGGSGTSGDAGRTPKKTDTGPTASAAAIGAGAAGPAGPTGAAAAAAIGGDGAHKDEPDLGAGGTGPASSSHPASEGVPGRITLGRHAKKGGALAGAAAIQPAAQIVLLMLFLNWLKSMFFMLAALVANMTRLIWMIIKMIVKAVLHKIAGFFSGIGHGIAHFFGFGGGAAHAISWGAGGMSILAMIVAAVAGASAVKETTAREGTIPTTQCTNGGTVTGGTNVADTTGSASSSSPTLDSPVTIVQANVPSKKGWTGKGGAAMRRIVSVHPDFVTLEEQYARRLSQLTSAVSGYQVWRDPQKDPANDAGGGAMENAIGWNSTRWKRVAGGRQLLIRRSVENAGHVRSRYAAWAVFQSLTDSSEQVVVISVHMPVNPQGAGGHGKAHAGRATAYGHGMDALKSLISSLMDYGPVLVGGDFNDHESQTQSWAAVPNMSGAGFQHTVAPSGGIDYVFFPSGSRVIAARALSSRYEGQWTSDHHAFNLTRLVPNGSSALTPSAPPSTIIGGISTSATVGVSTGTTSGAGCTCPTTGSGTTGGLPAVSVGGDQNQTDSAKAIYGVLHGWGMPDANIAGILGNWTQESGIDPTSVQGIFDEPYTYGPRKQAAIASGGTMGIGLGQWTGGRNTLLRSYARAKGENWYDLGLQLRFMADPNGDEVNRVRIFRGMIATSRGTPAQAAVYWNRVWEGSADGASGIGVREADAEKWYGEMSAWGSGSIDTDSIIDMDTSALPDAVSAGMTSGSCVNATGAAALGVGLSPGGLDQSQAQQIIDIYLKEGDAFLDARYGPNGGPGGCGSDHAMNCVSFVTYFMNKYTSLQKYAPGNGITTAETIASMTGKQTSHTPRAYSVASGPGSSPAGHTFIVLGVNSQGIIIGEAGYCESRGDVRVIPMAEATSGKWTYVDVSDLITDPTMKGSST